MSDSQDPAVAEDETELAVEGALRPASLAEFVGQQKVRGQLQLLLDAARIQQRPPDHILLSGPPGLGKTTLAMIVAHESERPLRLSSGPAIQHAGDLAAILSGLTEGEVLFLDEIHRTARPAAEMLYLAMEDFRVDVVVGKGVGATAIPIDIPRFTLVGATTRAGMLTNPLRDRFGIVARLEFYTSEELTRIVRRSAGLLKAPIDEEGCFEIARRSRGTPRIANRLLRRVRDYADVKSDGRITREIADKALAMLDVDPQGFDIMDRKLLEAVVHRFDGGPVGLDNIAASIGEESGTIEDVIEPYLIQQGFLQRTPRGRMATRAAYLHLGLQAPEADE